MHLEPGQGARVTMNIPVQRFRYWETSHKSYGLEVGDYEMLIGGASDDIWLRVPFKLAVQ